MTNTNKLLRSYKKKILNISCISPKTFELQKPDKHDLFMVSFEMTPWNDIVSAGCSPFTSPPLPSTDTQKHIHQIQEQACFWYTFCVSYLSDTVIEQWHGLGNTYSHRFLQPPHQCHARRSKVWLRKNDANEADLQTEIHYCEIKPGRVSATSVCSLISVQYTAWHTCIRYKCVCILCPVKMALSVCWRLGDADCVL